VIFEITLIMIGYIFLIYYLTNEQTNHFKRISKIKHRIHINGIRGKSSVTRLIGQILREQGIKTYTKTTGSEARLIDHNGEEKPIKRRIANINEQISIVEKISKHKPEALVVECMAIHPNLQRVCEEKMINATISVLTNVRFDHQDLMGWTLEEITYSLCEFIPTNSILVCGEQNPKLLKIIKEKTKKRNTKLILADNKLMESDKNILKKLNYIEHEENIALALKVAEILKIDKETATRGILNASPDPGVLKVYQKRVNGLSVSFINAHAANDRESIIKIYKILKEQGHLNKTNIGILYNRYDRPERAEIFADTASKNMNLDAIILIGAYKDIVKNKLTNNGFSDDKIFLLKKENLENLIKMLYKISNGNGNGKEINLIGMVNIHGSLVQKYIKYFAN